MKYFKLLFFASLSMVIGSFKANAFKASADFSLPMVSSEISRLRIMTETQEFLAVGDCILLVGFLVWIAYIVFFLPEDTFKKL